MSGSLNHFEDELIKIAMATGMNNVMAVIWAKIQLTPDEISMEELSKITGYSLATISNNIKILLMGKMMRRIKHPGTKKVYVKAERNMISLTSERLKNLLEEFIIPFNNTLPSLRSELKNSKNPSSKKLLEQLTNQQKQMKLLETFYSENLKKLSSMTK